ncbi:leucyl/phenylalanyl-tRNA--protein transferase [Thalassomonas actiniarum]|uniref:Leucyl/phenylalanyl-tRNA--protein transferase n=1 Tax=Thalassomonas actiniarum TaxID=485447 RepID=A0AAE9YL67_9GAMM|nr:leucyl/phenylalanyl-tRNA--protein transferase [Thalassomonas actiniarum]WDD96663.1 leucyl/phenylalanyl-tRNA--protein transferase [Thalassomonas actiniarum]
MIPQLHPEILAFPPLSQALTDPNGLLAFGGDLSLKRLVNAYTHGIFPWFNEGDPIMWWSPDPRAIIPVDDIKINRTLRKVINRQTFTVTLNRDFTRVLKLCAHAPFRKEGTWITPQMKAAYIALHQQGYAHSIEVWQENELVGGLYGVAINGFFSGESMFYKRSNASKVALLSLAKLLKEINITFIDCQILNPFLQEMGAVEISRQAFVELKETAINKVIAHDFWQQRTLK